MIRVKEPNLLDYEKISVLNFTIVAREANGNNPKESRANVQVHVRDVNDNAPDFSTSTYEAYVPENVEPGATIAWIRAEDEDSGILGTQGIRYVPQCGNFMIFLSLRFYVKSILGDCRQTET